MTAFARIPAPEVPSLIPEDAPFTREQRVWLNGFLAALLAPAEPAVAAAPAVTLGVLYASETGTAEGLARKLAHTARTQGFDATARDLGATPSTTWPHSARR